MSTLKIGDNSLSFNIVPQPQDNTLLPVGAPAALPPIPELSQDDAVRLGTTGPGIPSLTVGAVGFGSVPATALLNLSNPGSVVLAGLQSVDGASACIDGVSYRGTSAGWVPSGSGASGPTGPALPGVSQTSSGFGADTRFTVQNGNVLANGVALDAGQLNQGLQQAFDYSFTQGYRRQGGNPDTANLIPGDNGAYFVPNNRYGLDRDGAEFVASLVRQLYPAGAGANVVELQRNGLCSFPEYAIQIPGFAAPLAAGDLALMLMRPNESTDAPPGVGTLRASNLGSTFDFLNGARTSQNDNLGSFGAPLTAGSSSGLLQLNNDTWIFGPSPGGSTLYGYGAAGDAAVRNAFPNQPASSWFT